MHTILPVENGNPLKAIQGFLQSLLTANLVDALLAPMRTPAGAIVPTLVTEPALLVAADPLAPVLPVNGAILAGKLSVREPRGKVGVVLRACELRALVELVKMQQASLESLVLIAVDCAGTCSVPDYRRLSQGGQGDGLWRELFQAAASDPGSPRPELRLACKICEQPVFEQAQIRLELLGSDLERAIHLSLEDELAQKLGLQENGEPEQRTQVVENLIAARTNLREAEFIAIRARLEGDEGLQGVFADCIRCHNCMTVCPICYCKTCVFKSAIFDHEPAQFLGWARQKGAYRLPADALLFHLTRLNHMVLSCVGCGMCSEACPAELPVGIVFRAIGQRLQETFEYSPGRDPQDPLPLVTFKADEWTEVGE
jgi:formate dehydrogenase subunit beta